MSERGFVRFGKYELDCTSRELRKNGIRLKLDEQPLSLLEELVHKPGEVVTREQLRIVLWPDGTYVDFDRSLTRAVNKLRLALTDNAVNPRFIETVPRRGYRFIAPVSVSQPLVDMEKGASGEPPVLSDSSPLTASPAPPSASRLKFRFLSAALILAVLVWTGFGWKSHPVRSATTKRDLEAVSPAKALVVTLDSADQALFTKGRFLAAEPNRESIERGIRILEKLAEKNPGFAPVHAALAEGWFGLASVYLPPIETMPKARAAARRAIELDPADDDARALLGRVHVFYDWDWAGAEDQFRQALLLNPRCANAFKGRACLRMVQGRASEAVQDIDSALRLDPRSLWLHFMAVAFRTNARHYDDALRQARTSLEWEPRFGMLRSFGGVVAALNGDRIGSLHELKAGVQQQNVPTSLGFLALGNALAGRPHAASLAIKDLLVREKHQYVCPFEIASAYASLRNKDEAFRWLAKSVADRADCTIWLPSEPWLDPIRDDPRYSKLIAQLGPPPAPKQMP